MKSREAIAVVVLTILAGIFCFPLSAGAVKKLMPESSGSGLAFGTSLSVYNNTLIVGGSGDIVMTEQGEVSSGAAYIFTESGSSWQRVAKLAPNDPEGGDFFGRSVSIYGDYAAVGSPEDDERGGSSGAVYLFYHSNGQWTQQQKIWPSDGNSGDLFGNAVALYGNYLVVGAPRDDDWGEDSGSIYVYKRSGSQWSRMAKVAPQDASVGDLFGSSVALYGTEVLVGAPTANRSNQDNSGTAYIFSGSDSSWMQQAQIDPQEITSGALFGASVALTDGYALVGAPNFDGPDVDNAGAAFVFAGSGGNWTEQGKLMASDAKQADNLGKAVSISASYAIAGAPNSDPKGANSGAAYIFERSGSAWSQYAKRVAEDGGTSDQFGTSVSIYGQEFLIGAVGDDMDPYTDTGSAYVFGSVDDVELDFDPIISPALDDQISAAGQSGSVDFQVADMEAGTLTISYTNSDSSVVSVSLSTNQVSTSGDNIEHPVSLNYTVPSGTGRDSTQITVTVTDENGNQATDGFTFWVQDPPTIEGLGDPVTLNEGESETLNFTISDSSTPADSLQLAKDSSNPTLLPTNRITFGGSGQSRTVQVEPLSGKSGQSTVIVSVTDTDGDSASQSFDVRVNGGPVIDSISDITIPEDGQTEAFTVSVTDAEGGEIDVSVSSLTTEVLPNLAQYFEINGANGQSTTLNATAGEAASFTLRIIPPAGTHGEATIRVEAVDADGKEAIPQDFTLTISSVPDAPVIESMEQETDGGMKNVVEQIVSIDEGLTTHPIHIQVSDQDGGTLTITVTPEDTDLVPSGSIKINGTTMSSKIVQADSDTPQASLEIQPPLGQFGETYINVKVSDGTHEDTARFILSVSEVNDPPVFINVPSEVSTNEGTATSDILIGVEDPEGGMLTLTADSDSELLDENSFRINGTITQEKSYYATPGDTTFRLKLTPVGTLHGTAQVNLSIRDENTSPAEAETATLLLVVNSVNDPPQIEDVIIDSDMEEDDDFKVIPVTVGDPDRDEMTLTVEVESTPDALFTDSFFFGTGTVGPPFASVRESQLDGNNQATLSLSVKPNPELSGWGFFTITADDGALQDSETFVLIVAPKNDAPSITVPAGQPETLAYVGQEYVFSPQISDPDSTDLTILYTNVPPWASYDRQTGELKGTPTKADAGTKTEDISLIVSDGQLSDTIEPFDITVFKIEKPPQISSIASKSTTEGTPLELPFQVGDGNGDTLTVTVSHDNPQLIASAEILGLDAQGKISTTEGEMSDLTLRITPEPYANQDRNGDARITLTADDGNSTTRQTFTFSVSPADSLPVISGINNKTFYTKEDNLKQIDFAIQDYDWGTVDISASSNHTDVVATADIDVGTQGYGPSGYSMTFDSDAEKIVSLWIMPKPDAIGTARITVTATGDGNRKTEANFVLEVEYDPDSPEITPNFQDRTMDEDSTKTFPFTIDDPDGDELELIISSSNETIVPIDAQHIKINGNSYIPPYRIDKSVYEAGDVNLSITPAKDQNTMGLDPPQVILTFTARKVGSDLEAAYPLGVTINNRNDPPSISGVGGTVTMDEDTTKTIELTVSDVDTPLTHITMSVNSDNTQLIPNNVGNLSVSQVDAEGRCTLTLKPLAQMNSAEVGTALITLTADDNSGTEADSYSLSFTLNVLSSPDLPTINADTSSWSLSEDTPKDFNFTVNDIDQDELQLIIESSDPSVVPADGDHLRINGNNYSSNFTISSNVYKNPLTLGIIPVENAYTETGQPLTLTIKAKDDTGTGAKSFTVTVNAVNDPPTLGAISDQFTYENEATDPIKFKVSDVEDSAADLVVLALATSKPELVDRIESSLLSPPQADLNYQMVITPAWNQTGEAGITVQVVDNDGAASEPVTFDLNILEDEYCPIIDELSQKKTTNEEQSKVVDFSIYYDGLDPDELVTTQVTVYAKSSNTALVPNGAGSLDIEYRSSRLENTIHDYRLTITPLADAPTPGMEAKTAITMIAEALECADEQVFELEVIALNDPPTIHGLPTPIVVEEGQPQTFDFKVNDVDSAELEFYALSEISAFVPNSQHLQISGEGYDPSDNSLSITPGKGAELKLTVSPKHYDFTQASFNLIADDKQDSIDPEYIVEVTEVMDCDIDNSGQADLTDVILGLQIVAGIQSDSPIYLGADLNGDGAIGMVEAICAMRTVAGLN